MNKEHRIHSHYRQLPHQKDYQIQALE
jgi:hypothetical protein